MTPAQTSDLTPGGGTQAPVQTADLIHGGGTQAPVPALDVTDDPLTRWYLGI